MTKSIKDLVRSVRLEPSFRQERETEKRIGIRRGRTRVAPKWKERLARWCCQNIGSLQLSFSRCWRLASCSRSASSEAALGSATRDAPRSQSLLADTNKRACRHCCIIYRFKSAIYLTAFTTQNHEGQKATRNNNEVTGTVPGGNSLTTHFRFCTWRQFFPSTLPRMKMPPFAKAAFSSMGTEHSLNPIQ